MRKLLLPLVLGFIIVMAILSVYRQDDKPLPEKLERAMRLTQMMAYQDDDYDYTIRHPKFFEQTDDSLLDKGCCRFSFWQDSTEIVQTALVEPNPDSLTIEQAMQKYASDLHATQQIKGDDYFILSGSLHTDSGQIEGRRYYAKFVQHRKLWFVQSLTYPEDCEQAVSRLRQEIDKWKVWE